MTDTVTEDQAVSAIIMWDVMNSRSKVVAKLERFITDYTASNARYACVEMAREAEKVWEALAHVDRDRLVDGDMFHLAMLDAFDYTVGQMPRMKHSATATAAWIADILGLQPINAPAASVAPKAG